MKKKAEKKLGIDKFSISKLNDLSKISGGGDGGGETITKSGRNCTGKADDSDEDDG